MRWTADKYHYTYDMVFDEEYEGYRPNIIESPDGDGKWDTNKEYAHINVKYLYDEDGQALTPYAGVLSRVLQKETMFARDVAIGLGVPPQFWPSVAYSTIRLLRYPPGAVTHQHTDFDLFTLQLYRNVPETFVRREPRVRLSASYDAPKVTQYGGLGYRDDLSPGIHYGEMLAQINPRYEATPHEVVEDKHGRWQYSAVYFAIPDIAAVLPDGQTVDMYLRNRLARSRKEK